MEDNNKHNIFSKEEFFRMLDEKRSLPPEADDFDREAMEGLALVKDRSRLDKLDAAINQALAREKKLAARKRNIYYFSAAASIILIIGLFFILKENTVSKENDLALNQVTEQKPAAPMMTEPAKNAKEEPASAEVTASELKQVGRKKEATVVSGASAGLLKSAEVAPAEEKADKLTISAADGFAAGAGETALDDQETSGASRMSEGTTGKAGTTTSGNKNMLLEQKKTYDETTADYKSKLSYQTNTVWTSTETQAADASKKQEEQSAPQQKAAVQDERENSPAGVVATTGETAADEDIATNTRNDEAEKGKPEGDAKDKDKESTVSKSAGSTGRKRAKKRRSRAANYDSPKEKQQAAPAYYAQTAAASDTSAVSATSATFVGGEAALTEFINKNLSVSEPGKKGVAVAEFTVRPDGAVDTSSIKVVPPVKDCEGCRKDVLRMIKKMPRWQPARKDGRPREERRKLSVPYGAAPSKK